MIRARIQVELAGRSVGRRRVSGGRAPSGWEWNHLQPGEGAAELLLPRPALGKMQGEAARRAGKPSGQGEEPPPEGLGGHDLSNTKRGIDGVHHAVSPKYLQGYLDAYVFRFNHRSDSDPMFVQLLGRAVSV